VSDPPEPRSRVAVILLLVIVVVGGALRFYHLGSNSLWVDEFATLRISLLPVRQILTENIRNNSFEPPLYFWMIHSVVRAFGVSEAAIRAPSAAAGVLTIPAVWLLTREITGSVRTPLACASLVALNPLHLWYSQEARPYALLMLLVTVASLFLVHALREEGRAAWPGFASATLLAVFTHLTGLLLLPVAWIWTIAAGKWRRQVRPLLSVSGLVVACVAPLLLAIARASARVPGNGSPERPPTGLEIPYTLFTFLAGYSFGPPLRDIQNLGAGAAVATHPVETGLVVAALAALLVFILRAYGRDMTGFTALVAAYIGMTFLASVMTGKAYSVRYTLPALIGFLSLVGIGLNRIASLLGRASLALVLLLFAWADAQWFYSSEYHKDDSRAVVRWLAARLPEGSTVVTAPGYVSKILTYYAWRQEAAISFIPADSASDSPRPAALVLTRLHHVTDPRSVKDWFRRIGGGHAREDGVGGYDVLTTAGDPAQALHE
jgi:mannosyltransferase